MQALMEQVPYKIGLKVEVFCSGQQFYYSVFIFGSLRGIRTLTVSCQQCAILLAVLVAKQFDSGYKREFLHYLH